jgi:hypothetical protein
MLRGSVYYAKNKAVVQKERVVILEASTPSSKSKRRA